MGWGKSALIPLTLARFKKYEQKMEPMKKVVPNVGTVSVDSDNSTFGFCINIFISPANS